MTSRSRAILAAAATLFGGCLVEHPLEPGLLSFEVTVAEAAGKQDLGSEEERLAYVSGRACTSDGACDGDEVCAPTGQCALGFRFDVRAQGRDGLADPYTGPLHMRVTPGALESGSSVVHMEDGVLEDVAVFVARSVGPSHVWFEADGMLPLEEEGLLGACADGLDNDGNGLIDLADPGCAGLGDDLEAPVSLATGISPTIFFADPRVGDLQRTDLVSTSPLVGEQVRITAGQLVVTDVTNNGFYLMDLADDAGGVFHGLFVFTYSKPKGLSYQDVLCGLSGSVQEHVGMTQLTFPTFEVYDPESTHCAQWPDLDPDLVVPEPVAVTDALLPEGPTGSDFDAVYTNSHYLEQYEGTLVVFDDVAVSTRFVACDQNKNGVIDKGTPEADCRKACQKEPLCSDLEGFTQYNQYAGITAGKKKIYASVALVDSFRPLAVHVIGAEPEDDACVLDPLEQGGVSFIQYTCAPRTLATLAGALRHIYLCPDEKPGQTCTLQFWVVDPRFDEDVVVQSEATGEKP